jgi:gamma-glutamyltranspeptidase/glutathione hydrolase
VRGVVAAGHPETAEAGAVALRAGGNAVDAAIAAMLASFAAEPLLTGLGAGGYMLVGTPDGEDLLLDFFVEAPGRGGVPDEPAELLPLTVSFTDAEQVFHVGPASCGVYGNPAGVCAAHARFGTLPLPQLAAPAVRMAREGVRINAAQGYVFELLVPINTSTTEAAERFGNFSTGDVVPLPELADAIERLAEEGPAPFYTGDVAQRVIEHVAGLGGRLTAEDLAAYEPVPREPVQVDYRGHRVSTNAPPNAGGPLIARTLRQLDCESGPPALARIVAAMEDAQRARTPEFMDGLTQPGFMGSFIGNTTHISVVDGDGMACSVTCTNGEGSGVVVPGTGMHLNNIMGEEDLSPMGFHTHPPGRRMPSMMAPTLVRDASGRIEIVLGSAGSNRIRSAILQVILGVIDHGLDVRAAVEAARVHWEGGIVYAEPGIDPAGLEDHEVQWFRDVNMFFGGCQAVTGDLRGAGDPRRGGAVVSVEA